jgi:hypothetical protein
VDYRSFLVDGRWPFLAPLAEVVRARLVIHDVQTVASILRAGVDEALLDLRTGAIPIWFVYADILRVFSSNFADDELPSQLDWVGLFLTPFSQYLSRTKDGAASAIGRVLDAAGSGDDAPSGAWRKLHDRLGEFPVVPAILHGDILKYPIPGVSDAPPGNPWFVPPSSPPGPSAGGSPGP